jgi:hypothetical protein
MTINLDKCLCARKANELEAKRAAKRSNRHHKWKFIAPRKFWKKLQVVDRASLTFDRISPIASLWDEYARKMGDSEQAVTRMDLHGAKLTVLASDDPSLVGLAGRVVK